MELERFQKIKMSANEIKQRIVYVLTRKGKADDDDTNIYVKSTSKPLNGRLCRHRYSATGSGNENNRLYKRMREIGLEKWEILPLLSRACDLKTIREVEKNWVRILKADLNTNSPVREEETREEYQAAYYENNKETILQKQKECRMNNKGVNRYYCELCNVAFMQNSDLKKHLDTLKHSNAYMNSID